VVETVGAANADVRATADDGDAFGLSATEARLVRALLDGHPPSSVLGPGDPFVSVVADTINEKLFDVVGDAVIEFDGDEPRLVEDYVDDLREVLGI
jgi:hypothetical protein